VEPSQAEFCSRGGAKRQAQPVDAKQGSFSQAGKRKVSLSATFGGGREGVSGGQAFGMRKKNDQPLSRGNLKRAVKKRGCVTNLVRGQTKKKESATRKTGLGKLRGEKIAALNDVDQFKGLDPWLISPKSGLLGQRGRILLMKTTNKRKESECL